jgi:hypothetical protein
LGGSIFVKSIDLYNFIISFIIKAIVAIVVADFHQLFPVDSALANALGTKNGSAPAAEVT